MMELSRIPIRAISILFLIFLPFFLYLDDALGENGQDGFESPEVPVTRAEITQKALENNPSIVIYASEFSSKNEEIGIKKATYYPQIALNLDELFLNSPVVGISLPNETGIPLTLFNPTLNQEISGFGKRKNEVLAARLAKRSARWSLEEARLNVVWNAEIAFDHLAMVQHLLNAAKKNEKAAKIHLDSEEKRLSKGLAILPDVTQAKVYWETASYAVMTLSNELRKAQTDLGYSMGASRFSAFHAVEKGERENIPEDPNTLIAYALDHRPLIKSLESLDDRRNALIKRAYDENLPTLSAFANGLFLYGVPPGISGAPPGSGLFLPTYQTGITLSVPIFTGMKILHETQSERDKLRGERAKTRLARIRVIRNVRKAWFDLKTQEKKIALDEAKRENARINRNMVEKSFQKGLVDSVTRIQSQAQYLSAQEELIADRYRYKMIQDEEGRQIGLLPTNK
jgi:outer membrane protein